MATDIPYQAYKSKRHLRNLSTVSTPETELKVPATSDGAAVNSNVRRYSFQPPPPIEKDRGPSPAASTSASASTSTASSPLSTELHFDPSLLAPSLSRSGSSRFRHVPFHNTSNTTQLTAAISRPSPLASHQLTLPRGLPSPSIPNDLPTPTEARPRLPSNASQAPHSAGDSSTSIRVVSPAPVQNLSTSRGNGSASTSPVPAVIPSPSVLIEPRRDSFRSNSSATPAPYRAGFQPKGVYRHRTDEYLSARNSAQSEGQVERQRLERRLEKIIQLHFSPDKPNRRPPAGPHRESSVLGLDLTDLKSKGAGNLWRAVVESRLSQNGAQGIRESEQMIVPWQNDKEVAMCPICSSSFHPLTNRKHHCRTCGRVVCSLPVKPPVRPRLCSFLFVADAETGCIEEVAEGVDYGVKRGNGQEVRAEEKFLKGVRICQDCRPTLIRKQYELESKAVPLYARLYKGLVELEGEIDASLSRFEELMVIDISAPSSQAARQKLLEIFAEYEHLAKRIRNLPTNGNAGNSQERIQKSIAIRASLFLQKNMLPLKVLPKGTPPTPPAEASAAPAYHDHELEVAAKLQPLLEQEAILESFIEEARVRRKFDDLQSLSTSLKEIRAEIKMLSQSALQ